MKRLAIRILRSLLLGLVLLWVLALLSLNSLIFRPPEASYALSSEHRKLTLDRGEEIILKEWRSPGATRWLIYSHGNAEDLGHVEFRLEMLSHLNLNVVGYDYPGYGHSSGSPSTRGATAALEAVLDDVQKKHGLSPGQLILYGRSVGSGPTLEVAAQRPVGGIILESAFRSIARTRFPFSVPGDVFLSEKNIRNIQAPLLVIHGTEDFVIPVSHGKALFEAAPGPKEILLVEGAGHNNLLQRAGPAYWQALQTFLDRLAQKDPQP